MISTYEDINGLVLAIEHHHDGSCGLRITADANTPSEQSSGTLLIDPADLTAVTGMMRGQS